MHKPKILIPLTVQFSVRYLIRTGMLRSIKTFADPVIVLGWDDPDLYHELESDDVKVYRMPSVRSGRYFNRVRKKIHLLHFDHIDSPSTVIDNRRRQFQYKLPLRILITLRSAIARIEYRLQGGQVTWNRLEDKFTETDTNFSEFQALVSHIQPDLFFSMTPYYIEEEFLGRAVAKTSSTLIAAILSFDNITTRPRIPVLFHHYLLWNEYNRRELLRIYPNAAKQRIDVVGAPQFDFYYDQKYILSEDTWRNKLSLNPDRPVILFGAGLESIAPVEPHILSQLDRAISQGAFRNSPQILLRLHPLDNWSRWDTLQRTAKNVVFDVAWTPGKETPGKTNVTHDDIAKLASTLKYCCVHINTSSTMTIDGAIFNRPQIGPAYDDRPGKKYDRIMRELYLREHFLPITQSGGLQIAGSYEQLVMQIQEALQFPERYSTARENMVRQIITWTDGNATGRVIEALYEDLHFFKK